ncbi:MAG: hypothetical protein MUC87_16125 [Bacteroidia bacterium]|jgi:hypothetical protein|nr:hypothetical protein [Bacteroidia bacterium]
MKKLFITLFGLQLLGLCNANAQSLVRVRLSGGVMVTRLQFEGMNTFAANYNAANAGSLKKEMKYRPMGYGLNAQLGVDVAAMYTAINIGTSRTLTSMAELEESRRRIFFRSWNFDVLAGGWIKNTIAPYFGMAVNAMQLRSFTKYNNGIESWGSERLLNGVFWSWRAEFVVGARVQRSLNGGRILYFADFLFPVTKKPRIEFGFTERTNSTEDYDFPLDPGTIGSSNPVLLEPLVQNYRNMRLSFGLTFLLYGENE